MLYKINVILVLLVKDAWQFVLGQVLDMSISCLNQGMRSYIDGVLIDGLLRNSFFSDPLSHIPLFATSHCHNFFQ